MPEHPGADLEFRNGMPFFGGSLWLDLLNTTPMEGNSRRDLIATTDGLRDWLAAADLAEGTPPSGPDIRHLREALRGMVDLLRAGDPVPAAVIATVNGLLDGVSIRCRLTLNAVRPRLVQARDTGASGPAGAVAADFARFLCDHDPGRLRKCSNPACNMVFYDRGKNNTRRWCSMRLCGNRDKVARYRARKGSGQAGSEG